MYNEDNRLVGIALPNGGSNAFDYDANGLRTKKTDSTGTTRYLLDGLSIIAQYAPDGAKQAWYTQSLARIDEVLNVVNDDGKHWYQADALGSVYGLANGAGALVGQQGFDVFGAPVPAPTGPTGQPFGFTGREHDLDAALVYARARYLNPSTGRWDKPDALGFVDGLNLFAYARNGPTRWTDPTGQYVQAIAIVAWTFLMVSLSAMSFTAMTMGIIAFNDPHAAELDDLAHVMAGLAIAAWGSAIVAMAMGGPASIAMFMFIMRLSTVALVGYSLWCAYTFFSRGATRATYVCIRNIIDFYQRGRNPMELIKPLNCE